MKRSSFGSLLLAVLWAASIFATSSGVVTVGQLAHTVSTAAGGHISESGFRHFWGLGWWIFVKGWHAAEFGILFLLIRGLVPNKPWIAAVLAGAFAISDEFHQLFVHSRGCRVSDVCIDWLGIAAAWAFASGWMRATARRPWMLAAVSVAWISLVFLLSVYPFGLLTLGPTQANGPRP